MRATPPHNLDAERAALGSVLIRPPIFADVAASLRTDDFFLPAHREVFDAMAAVTERQMPCDPLMVADELKARGSLQRMEGGEGYLLDLAGAVPTAENVTHYIALVSEASIARKVIGLCAETQSRAYGSMARGGELVEQLSAELAKVVIPSASGDLVNAGELVGATLEEIEHRKPGTITGTVTGVYELDRLTCGSDPTDLVVIAADPGGGKTALANQIAILNAVKGDGTALICNLEMRKSQILERALVTLAHLNSFAVREGRLSLDDHRALFDAGHLVSTGKLYIEDKLCTVAQIASRARAWRARHPRERATLVVDYVQRLSASAADETDNRAQQIGQFTKALKGLAVSLEITVVLLSQLSRKPTQDKRPPTMRDLRESGDIEADADTIVLIHNPDRVEDGPIDLILDKNRKGPCRRVPAHWNARYYEFVDVGGEPQQQQQLIGAGG